MRIDVFDQTIELATNRSIVLHHARHAEILCVEGILWITEDPLRNDIALRAGQSHVVKVDAMAFVTAVTPSTLRLSEPVRAPAWRRAEGSISSLAGAMRSRLARWRRSAFAGRAAA